MKAMVEETATIHVSSCIPPEMKFRNGMGALAVISCPAR